MARRKSSKSESSKSKAPPPVPQRGGGAKTTSCRSRRRKGGKARERRGGRPTKCDLWLADEIGDLVAGGASVLSAAEDRGISRQTLDNWAKKADQGDPLCREFFDVLRQAHGYARVTAEQAVHQGREGWRSAARWLETNDPERWGRRHSRDQSTSQGGPTVKVQPGFGLQMLERMREPAEEPPAPGLRSPAENRRLAQRKQLGERDEGDAEKTGEEGDFTVDNWGPDAAPDSAA